MPKKSGSPGDKSLYPREGWRSLRADGYSDDPPLPKQTSDAFPTGPVPGWMRDEDIDDRSLTRPGRTYSLDQVAGNLPEELLHKLQVYRDTAKVAKRGDIDESPLMGHLGDMMDMVQSNPAWRKQIPEAAMPYGMAISRDVMSKAIDDFYKYYGIGSGR